MKCLLTVSKKNLKTPNKSKTILPSSVLLMSLKMTYSTWERVAKSQAQPWKLLTVSKFTVIWGYSHTRSEIHFSPTTHRAPNTSCISCNSLIALSGVVYWWNAFQRLFSIKVIWWRVPEIFSFSFPIMMKYHGLISCR